MSIKYPSLNNPVIFSFGQEPQPKVEQTRCFTPQISISKLEYVRKLIDRYQLAQIDKDSESPQTVRIRKEPRWQSQNRDQKNDSTGRCSPSGSYEYGQSINRRPHFQTCSQTLQISHHQLIQKYLTPVRRLEQPTQQKSTNQIQLRQNITTQFSSHTQKKKVTSSIESSEIPLVQSLLVQGDYQQEEYSNISFGPEFAKAIQNKRSTDPMQQSLRKDELKPSHMFIVCVIILIFLFWAL